MDKETDLKKDDCLPNTKVELALKYNSKTSTDNAVRILRTWIQKNPELVSELRKTNYNSKNKLITPNQVRIIYKYLGEPP